jgi:predicted ATPase
MYLNRVNTRNFMIHKDSSIELLPLTVLVGQNSGGKSSFFDALINFSMLSRGNLRQAFGPYPYSYAATVYAGASPTERISFDVTMSKTKDSGDSLKYEISYKQTSFGVDPRYTIFNERLTLAGSGKVLFDRDSPAAYPLANNLQLEDDRSVFASLRAYISQGGVPDADELVLYCARNLSRFSKYRLEPYALSSPSRLPEAGIDGNESYAPRLGYRGEDLAGVLYYLNETDSPELKVIKEQVREIVPEFKDFEFNVVGTDRIAFSVSYDDERGVVPAVRLSSGLLSFIGLMVVIFGPGQNPLLMIEEPENGLTPSAVRAFYVAITNYIANSKPEGCSQIIISSHSPFVICEAWNGEDRDFIHRVEVKDGSTVIRKFSDVVAAHGIQLRKDGEKGRVRLGLQNAEDIMSGFYD